MSFNEIQKSLGKTKIFKKTFPSISFSLDTHDYWGLLFICCLSLFQPKIFILALIYMCLKINRRMVAANKPKEVLKEKPDKLEQLILFIHMNHLQSLAEAIESNPELLYCDYKKKSLPYWCKHYNNTKALIVVTQMTQKYPKEELLVA